MKYRANIDGLRAVAVLSVIFFHAGFEVFSGGFVGVDVFFVISGYLIGSIIIADTSTNKFSFVKFYARRAGRILPALFFVMLLSIPFAYLFLVPNQLKDFSKSLIYVSTFVSNMYFMKHVNYFDTAVELKPLIHTWSLSIEEQYYLFFPALMLLTVKFRRYLKVMMVASLALVSFSALQLHSGSTNAFYSFHTRCWELLIGVLVAYAHVEASYQYGSERLKKYSSYIGFGLVLLSIIFLSNKYPYPSFYTLIPTIGTALVLLSISHKNAVNDFLSLNILVGVGLLSYSAYLWHQPIFAFARLILLAEPSVLFRLILVAVTFFLAFLTWKYVETPCRRFSHTNKKLTLQLSCAVCLFFIILGSVGEKNNGYPQRYSLPVSVLDQINNKHYIACDGICQIGDLAKSDSQVALFGDSHAASMAYMFDKLGKDLGVGIIYSGRLSCPPLLGAYAEESSERAFACIKRNNENYEYVKNHRTLNKVFLVSRWSYYTDGDYQSRGIKSLRLDIPRDADDPHRNFEYALQQTVSAYQKLGVKVYLVSQAPMQKVDSEELYYQVSSKNMHPQGVVSFLDRWSISNKDHKKLQAFVNQTLLSTAKKYNGVTFVNMDIALCGASVCPIGKPNSPFYADNNHLTENGAFLTYPLFLKLVKD